MTTHPPTPCLFHGLPPAPHFVGRESELDELRSFWKTGSRGVLALVGLGGAGKTAVASRFLEELLNPDNERRPDGLFVWSFYQEPDAGLFLKQAYRYFSRAESAVLPAHGAGLLHLLRDVLAVGGPHLLVLDGLERVQRPGGDSTDVYGQIEDPLLRGLLTRVAEGSGNTAIVVTSRFPLTDLEAFRDQGYTCLDVGGLGRDAAFALLRSRGVHGDDAMLTRLTESYGAHALTLDHLGGLIGQFLDGNPARAPEVTALDAPADDRQAFRLGRLLRAYEEHLPPEELALLCRLCLLRRNVTEEQIHQLFLCTPAVHARTIREVPEMIRNFPDLAKHITVSFVIDLSDSIHAILEEALSEAPLAGPEEGFRHEFRMIVPSFFELFEKDMEWDYSEFARLYAGKDLSAPTDQLPLPAKDREVLRDGNRRYLELLEHPLYPFKKKLTGAGSVFHPQGYAKSLKGLYRDFGPHDILQALKGVCRTLCYLTAKHYALRRVREVCRRARQKWAMSGPLAHVDAVELHQVLDALIKRHLILREADDSFSVHPAVRDHFHRLATTAGQGNWHDLVREQLVSLVRQPGKRLPEDAVTLGLVEEAIHHTLQAGRAEEAWRLFDEVLGGLRHMAWKLGEMARGLRILRAFEPCPDHWTMAWFLRALGEFEEAYRHNELPYFRADVRLLQGRLPEVAREDDPVRTAVARFLMGETTDVPPDTISCAIPRAQIMLYLGRLDRVQRSAEIEDLYHDMGREGDRARCRLILAEVARRQGDAARGRDHWESAAAWILHAGSVEHLCLLHLVRARLAREAGLGEVAQRAVAEGIHTARHGGLGLYYVELLCEQGEVCLARADAPAAEGFARAALERALAVDCQFRWGAAEAGHLLGTSLIAQQNYDEARRILEKTQALRRQIGDPRVEQTERLLELGRELW